MTGLQSCALQLLFHVIGYAQAHYLVKNLAEVFSVCEADFIGDVLHRYLPFVQKLHCFPDPVFPDKPRKGSSDVPRKEAAQLERVHGAQTKKRPCSLRHGHNRHGTWPEHRTQCSRIPFTVTSSVMGITRHLLPSIIFSSIRSVRSGLTVIVTSGVCTSNFLVPGRLEA